MLGGRWDHGYRPDGPPPSVEVPALRPRLLPALLVLAALASACSDDSSAAPLPAETATAPAAPTTAEAAAPTTAPPAAAVAPLTGVATDDPSLADRPVLAVKIENSAAARPQAGLDVADVVYEEIVEGGITRFIALFHSRVPAVIGPVRSARPEDVEVLPAYAPILVYSGARDDVTASLRSSGMALITDDGSGVLTRDPGRARSHDLMGDGPALLEKGAALPGAEPARPVFTHDPEPPAGAVTCAADAPACGEELTVRFSGAAVTGWTYDAGAGVYRRSQNGEPSVVTGPGRIGAANVVVLGMQVGTGGCCDAAGTPFTVTTVVGEGPAVVLRDGRRYDVTWRKTSPAAHLELLADGDTPLPLAPGATWIHLAPVDRLPA